MRTLFDHVGEKKKRLNGFYMPGTRPVSWRPHTGLWQSRIWLGRGHGCMSLGLHRSMRVAHRVWSIVIRRYAESVIRSQDPRALIAWRCAREVWPSFAGPFRLLPKWVHPVRVGDATKYIAESSAHGISTSMHETPDAAFLELWGIICSANGNRRHRKITQKIDYPGLFDGHE